MEDINWTGLALVGLFLLIVFALVGFSNYEKRRAREAGKEKKKAVLPPNEHLLFLVSNYSYSPELAEQMWEVIREPGADAGFLAIQIYARKLYVERYLILSKSERARYEWNKRGADLTKEIERIPDYWAHQSKLLDFVSQVRSYTG